MVKNVDVIISGGGLAGQTLGLALARAGLHPAIIERGKMEKTLSPNFDGRASALSFGPLEFLAKLGLWDELKTNATPINDIRIVDGDVIRGASPLIAHFNHKEIGVKNSVLYPERTSQPFGVIIENRFLRHALMNNMSQQKNISIYEEASIVDKIIDDKNVTATLSSGDVLSAPLLVIAEGKMSGESKNISSFYENNYAQTAIVLSVRAARPHHGVAVEFFYPAGPFAMLPLPDNKMNVVWTEKPAMAEKLLALPAADFHAQLAQRFTDWLGDIEIVSRVFSYPLGVRHAHRYGNNRQLLIADSAHSIHPIAGQGFNLGIKDIIALTDILSAARNDKQDMGANNIITRYQRARRYDNQKMLLATDALNKLFATSNDMVTAVRRLGLLGFDQMDFLKKQTVRYAMGIK
ncbi:MAG: UbiH/UbiF/VisC/COQ6 family ubiquinone biosynthesis hydroxylase [Hydrotalea sp.]|nr:UbiH/UbiF/VisC/COQ6 family ubiquinone biosynthesis hydroxylase [Hydrotalea sp.]